MKNVPAPLVLVLGLGESGLAMARWCAHQGCRVRVADTRAVPPGLAELRAALPEAEVVVGPFSEPLLAGIERIALSPGIDPRIDFVQEAQRRGIAIVGELTLFAEALESLGAREHTRIVAITGTNGKTTTTALVTTLLRAGGLSAAAAGNISPSVLSLLLDCVQQGRALPACWVLELSSFQVERMRGVNAEAATVLNVSDDHLDRHGSIEQYAQIKARIFDGDGVQVLNRDDPRVMEMARPGRSQVSFGTDAPLRADDYGLLRNADGEWLVRGEERLLRRDALRIVGTHNVANALAALALAEALGCARAPMLEALRNFSGLPHRVALVAMREDGVAFYDDSKGTNVGSTVAALVGLGRRAVLIAGGDGKGQDFSPLRAAVAEHARATVLIGRDAARIEAALAGLDLPIEHARDMDDAVQRADALAHAGDAVLLSPACASLDMFRSYVDRAEAFIRAVHQLQGVTTS